MRLHSIIALVLFLALPAGCAPPDAIDAAELLRTLPQHLGKRVTIKARFKAGARCRMNDPEAEWKTYCKDCQYCRGPLVLDTGAELEEGLDDWPLILGGTWKHQDIRCKGPLNKVECYPFEEGKTYIVQGYLENQKPPKLLVRDFWEVKAGG